MVKNYIYIALFASFPETILMLLLGFYLSNIRTINLIRCLIIAIIQTCIAFIIMIANIKLGLHTIIQIASLYALVLLFFDIKPYKAIVPVFNH